MSANHVMVDARLPLALLHALRDEDMPPELLPDEDPELSFPQRLGLSTVVHRQIREFDRLARRGRRVDLPQAEALVRLIARRPDADRIFDAAGSDLARTTVRGTGRVRRLARYLPQAVRYRAAARALRSLRGDVLIGARSDVRPSPFELSVSRGLTIRADPDGNACRLYAALARSVLELHGAKVAAIVHDRCEARGESACVWEAVRAGDRGSRAGPADPQEGAAAAQ